ncbi:MAG: acyl-CoA dehydrogenase family protein [Novosphingobium sp.]
MDLALNEDQRQIIDFLDGLTRPYAAVPMHDCSLALVSAELDAELAEGGFLDVMAMEELGPVTAALVIERLARLPFAVEAAASALLRIALDPELPRPLCLVEEGRLSRPLRYLAPGATVVVVGERGLRSFTASEAQIKAVTDEPIYAYPLAYLAAIPSDVRWHDMAPAEALRLWRVGLAAETAGLLAAALDSVKTYTSERKQFGRPIATFQALRHRMAETQVLTNAAYWLALRAAGTGDAGDAALAVAHALDTAKRVGYDFHQFMGAMGMTLEHPLHLWTYRLKFLTGELGGRGANAAAAAEAIWG